MEKKYVYFDKENVFGDIFYRWVDDYWDTNAASILYHTLRLFSARYNGYGVKGFWDDFELVSNDYFSQTQYESREHFHEVMLAYFSDYDVQAYEYFHREETGKTSIGNKDSDFSLKKLLNLGLEMLSDREVEGFSDDIWNTMIFEEGNPVLNEIPVIEIPDKIVEMRKDNIGWNRISKIVGLEIDAVKDIYIRYMENNNEH